MKDDPSTGYYIQSGDNEPVWHECEGAELEERQTRHQETLKYQRALEAPKTLDDVQDAMCELGNMASNNDVSINDIMDAITELGNLVSELMEGQNG